MEASFGWAWLSDLMLKIGLEPHLSNCYKVEQMRKARSTVKTNKKDADILSLLPFEASNWWEVWLAPKEVRDRREWMRYRAGLVALQTETKNRIHSILHRHGIFHEYTDLFGVQGRAFLVGLCADEDTHLPAGALRALRGHVILLEQIRRQLADIARSLRLELERSPLTQRLKTIPGVGLILSHVLVAEIGHLERFANHRKLASYCCLAPRSYDTGEDDPDKPAIGRHIGQRGNRTLKWAFIEAAHGAVHRGGRWRRMFDKYTTVGKNNRNRGYIKVARELVKVVYAVWNRQMPYMDNPPRVPGRVRRKSRSGKGQLSPAMVKAS